MLAAGYLLILLAAILETEPEPGATPVEVQFDGPASCSSAKAFFASLRSRTTHVRTAEGDEARTTLQVRLTRDRARIVGELRTIDDSGATDVRRVQGTSCEDVVQALSLTAALALDPTAMLSVSPEGPGVNEGASDKATVTDAGKPAAPVTDKAPVPPSEKPPAEPIVEKPSQPVPPTAPPQPSPQRPVPSVELGAEALGLSLLSGEFNPGLALTAFKNFRGGHVFSPALGLALVYARNDVLATPSHAAAALVAAAASTCPVRVSASILTIQPCAAMWGGVLGSAGRQLTREKSVNHLWLSAGMTLRIVAFLGHGLSLQVEGGLQAPLIRRRYFATIPKNVIAETPTISPVVGLGLTYGY